MFTTIKKLFAAFNTAARTQEDVALRRAAERAAEKFHLSLVPVHAGNWDETQTNPSICLDGMNAFYFTGTRSLRLPSGVLANTLRAEVLKQLPDHVRADYRNRITIAA
jgi:hypothetical protein